MPSPVQSSAPKRSKARSRTSSKGCGRSRLALQRETLAYLADLAARIDRNSKKFAIAKRAASGLPTGQGNFEP